MKNRNTASDDLIAKLESVRAALEEQAFISGCAPLWPSTLHVHDEAKVLSPNELLSSTLTLLTKNVWHVTESVDDKDSAYHIKCENVWLCNPVFATKLITEYQIA